MKLTIKLFATLKDIAGSGTIDIEIANDPTNVADIRQAIIEQYPELAPALPNAVAAVNKEYVKLGQIVHSGDEIAFFPPVSGGNIALPEHFELIQGAVDLNTLTQKIVTPETGAIALFSGYVRGKTHADNGIIETIQLEYEAYEPMALEKMKQVANEIRNQWPKVLGIAIAQSLGTLSVSQPTVLIACGAGHRHDGCFDAAQYGIDRLKEIVPVWKKEVHPDRTTWIEGSYHPTEADRDQS